MPKLLFVDDEPNEFLVSGKPLQIDFGWDAVHAAGPTEAIHELKKAVSENVPFDVVIVDRRMPDPETGEKTPEVGDELLADINATWPFLCTIVLTNYSDIDAAQRATKNGAFRYFVKDRVSTRDLERACRKGMRRQQIQRVRRSVLCSNSTTEILALVSETIRKVFSGISYCYAYTSIKPGGSLCVLDLECDLQANTQPDSVFLRSFSGASLACDTRRSVLKSVRSEFEPGDEALLEDPGSQLVVPVLCPEANQQTKQAQSIALICLESKEEYAFDQDDADSLAALADYVAVALERAEKLSRHGNEERDSERQNLLAEVAHRIFNPLQIAQSTLDLLQARLERGDTVSEQDLGERLVGALTSIEAAIEAAKGLHEGTRDRKVKLKPLNLVPLVEDVVSAFGARAEAAYCSIETKLAKDISMVNLNYAELRYVLGCLLDNAIEAISDAREANDRPMRGLIEVTLLSDAECKSVMLSVSDNGPGISPDKLPYVFERSCTSKLKSYHSGEHGLGLWEARRFVQYVGGNIEALNRSDGGAEFRMFFPSIRPKTDEGVI